MHQPIDFRSWRKGYFFGAFVAITGTLVLDFVYESGKRAGMIATKKKDTEAFEIAIDKFSPKFEEEIQAAFERGFNAGRDEGIRIGSLKNMEQEGGADE